MSRIMISNSSLASLNNNKAARCQPVFVKKAIQGLLTLAIGATLNANALAAGPVAVKAPVTPAPATAANAQKDPLAGNTWHAVGSTWPGTLVFDGAKKSVTLAPIGATPMQATYSYTVKPSSAANVVDGTLRMTNTAKQVSNAIFHIEGKKLTLSYAGGPRPETFVRMTLKEEEAEKARLKKLIAEGRIRPLK